MTDINIDLETAADVDAFIATLNGDTSGSSYSVTVGSADAGAELQSVYASFAPHGGASAVFDASQAGTSNLYVYSVATASDLSADLGHVGSSNSGIVISLDADITTSGTAFLPVLADGSVLLNGNGHTLTVSGDAGSQAYGGGISVATGTLVLNTDVSNLTGAYAVGAGGKIVFATDGSQTITGALGGTGTYVVSGSGTSTISQANSFGSRIELAGGKLALTAASATGSAGIVFDSGVYSTLSVATGVTVSGDITGFAFGDSIDLRGFDPGSMQVAVSGNTVSVSDNQGHAETLTIDGASGDTFKTMASSDGVDLAIPRTLANTADAAAFISQVNADTNGDSLYVVDTYNGAYTQLLKDNYAEVMPHAGTFAVIDESPARGYFQVDLFGVGTQAQLAAALGAVSRGNSTAVGLANDVSVTGDLQIENRSSLAVNSLGHTLSVSGTLNFNDGTTYLNDVTLSAANITFTSYYTQVWLSNGAKLGGDVTMGPLSTLDFLENPASMTGNITTHGGDLVFQDAPVKVSGTVATDALDATLSLVIDGITFHGATAEALVAAINSYQPSYYGPQFNVQASYQNGVVSLVSAGSNSSNTMTVAGDATLLQALGLTAGSFDAPATTVTQNITGDGLLIIHHGANAPVTFTGALSWTGESEVRGTVIFATDISNLGSTGKFDNYGTITFQAASNETLAIQLTASGVYAVTGAGTLSINRDNGFYGQLQINSGHVALGSTYAAGGSTIVFSGTSSLAIAAGVQIGNNISGFVTGDTIDLTGFDAATASLAVTAGATSAADILTVTDGNGHSETLHIAGASGDAFRASASSDGVLIQIAPPFVNSPPALTGTQATLSAGTEDTVYTIHLSDLVHGFTDADGDTLSVTGLSADHGTISQIDAGTWQLTPDADYFGAVGLSYTVSDGRATPGTIAATETLNLTEVADTVSSSVTYALTTWIENLTLTGTANIDGTGNALNNLITGNSGNNHIDGGAGADTMVGGLGDDTYYVDNTGDVVTEKTGEGTDTVISSVTYGLGANVENLTLTGSSAINGSGNTFDNHITGNAGDNQLAGNGGNDVLDGGAGTNYLYGGAGDDTYIVNSVNDHALEAQGGIDQGGNDTVMSSITYGLGAYIENLVLTGSASLNGSGNSLDNHITGNSGDNQLAGLDGNDTLDGGAGVNWLYGGAGDDTYIVNSVNDHALEVQGGIDQGGNDTVISSISYVLGTGIENLTLSGSASLNGSGNTLDNHITGNSGDNQLAGLDGNDTLDGGAGVNYLYGGAGNDTYYVHTTDDHVLEQTVAGVDDGGTDTVISDISYKLGAFIENLTLAGALNINATGNYLNNVITGNSGNNVLEGRLGNDTFVLGGPSNNGLDHLTDFTSGSDKLEFHAADYGFAASHVMTSDDISFTGSATASHAQFVYDTTTHTLSWDADGSGSGTAVQLVVFDNGATPTTADFLFV